MNRFHALALLAGALAMTPGGHSQDAKNIDVKIVKYEGLKELVLKNRGKVVLVDIWFTL